MPEPTIEERDQRCPFCDLLLAECACEDLSEDDEESLDDYSSEWEDEEAWLDDHDHVLEEEED